MLLVVKDSKKVTSWWKLTGEWFGAVLTMRPWTSWRNAQRDKKHLLEFRGEVGTVNNLNLVTSLLFWNVTSRHDRTFSLAMLLSQPRCANRYLRNFEATWPGCNGQTFHSYDLYTVVPWLLSATEVGFNIQNWCVLLPHPPLPLLLLLLLPLPLPPPPLSLTSCIPCGMTTVFELGHLEQN